MTAALYVLGGPDVGDRSDFRYSLRSLTNAPTITEVWAIGDVPQWFAGTTMRTPPLDEKFANQRQSLTWFANYIGAPTEFYLFNDDMYVTQPIDGQLPTYHLGSAQTYLAKANPKNTWVRAVNATTTWMRDRGHGDLLLYEAHTPLLFDTATLRTMLAEYPDQPLAVGSFYPEAGRGGPGTNKGNAKCKQGDSLTAKLSLDMPYLSGSDDVWQDRLGHYIRTMLPEPCRWER